MEYARTLHFIDSSSRNRAVLANMASDLGFLAEVYSNSNELIARSLQGWMIVARDEPRAGGIKQMIADITASNIWLPVIAIAEAPDIERVVAAIRAGALNYLAMPLEIKKFGNTLRAIEREAAEYGAERRRMLEARNRISQLSRREAEVIELLTHGYSNKAIARELNISPRTVEIHRSNMMTKLGAGHVVEAVKIRLDADADGVQRD